MPTWLDEDAAESIELPWIEAYVREQGISGTPLMVLSCKIKPKGVLICTAEWKAFIFKGTATCQHLEEALPAYAKFEGRLPKMIAVATANGKAKIGLETEGEHLCYWKFNEEAYTQHEDNPKKKGKVTSKKPINPLMPSLATSVNPATIQK